MQTVVEPESKKMEYDVLIEPKAEVSIALPKEKARRIYRAPTDMGLYAKPLSGLVAIVGLLFLPLITIPGMVILVLVAEVYLLDWTYSKVILIRNPRSAFSNESTEKSPEDEIDRKITRISPKDQLMR